MSNSPQNKFPIVFVLVIIAFIFPRLIPLLIVGFLFYKIITSNQDLLDKIRTKTVDLKADPKGAFSYKFNSPKFNFPPMKVKHFLISGLIVLLALVIIDGFVSVPAGHVAVIFDRGRGVLEDELPEGLHLKIPFWQEAKIFTTKKQAFTMAGEYQGIQDEDAVRGRSKDGQDVTVDVTITYQINGDDTPFLRIEFLTENGYKMTIVNPAARSVVYDSISKFNALELVAEKRAEFASLISEQLQEVYQNNKITLHEVFVRNVTFSAEFARSVEDKQIAEQKIKTAENRKKEAEQVAEQKIIEARAEAEAIRLKGESLRESPEVIQLEFVNKMAPNINWGILPDGALPLMDLKSLQQ